MLRRFVGFLIVCLVVPACSHDDTASAHSRNGTRANGDGVAPRPAVIAPAAEPYKIVSVAGGGTITGTVDFDGTPPAAEVVRPSTDQKVCGNSVVQKTITLSGTRVSGAVVWLTDIRSGKGFALERQ